MTLEEAVRVLREKRLAHTVGTADITDSFAVLIAHAERTIAARSEEPEGVRVIRFHAQRQAATCDMSSEYAQVEYIALRETTQYIDFLTAALDAAQAQARQQSIDTTLPVVRDWEQMREERDAAERALQMRGYRKSCDIPACNCGDQWLHGGTAERRLHEVLEERDTARAELAAVREKLVTAPTFTHPKAGTVVRAADILAALGDE
jgi:hypothetical protein